MLFFLSSSTIIPLYIVTSFQCFFSLETKHVQISAKCKIKHACSCPRLHNCCGQWEGWDPDNWFNHTSWVGIITPTDRPKLVCNLCVIEVFGGVFCVVTLLFGFLCRCRGFCHRTESDIFLFL